MTSTELFSQALTLPPRTRVRLVSALLSSLDDPGTTEVADAQAAWVAVAERRLDDVRSGRVTLVEWSQVRLAAMRAARRVRRKR